MNTLGRKVLWLVFLLQFLMLVLALWLVAVPLAKRSASDLAGLMVLSANTWEDLSPDHRIAFAHRLQKDSGIILERGILASITDSWKPHWYAEWVRQALQAQGMPPIQVNMQKEMVEVLLLVDDEPVILRAPSPSLGRVFAIFGLVSSLAMLGTLLALWWQKRWQLQMWRHQLVLSGLAHDFRTPLTRLKLQIALLESVSETQKSTMNRQLSELAEMIDTTLTLATQRQTQATAFKSLSELWQAWQIAYPDISFRAEKTALTYSAPYLLGRIGQNMIDNALVHGQGKVHVELIVNPKKGWQLLIYDEGKGIPDQVWRAIERNQPPPARGVGLGLLGSRWLAEVSALTLERSTQGVSIAPIDKA